MPSPALSSLAIALGVVLALGLVSCGEEDAELLPGGTAREITANLDTVQRLADEGDCVGAESAALQVSEQVEALKGVDERLERALRQGASRLNEVVARCEEEEAVEVAPPPTEEEPEEEAEPEKDEEKQREKEEKEREREDRGEGDEEAGSGEGDDEGGGPPPPQSEGKGKGPGNGNGNGPPSEGEGGGTPSGGLGPGSPVDEGG